ncbi:MAG: sulfotransferase [Woeseiaceae bacterium]
MSPPQQLTIDEALLKAKKAVRKRQLALAARLYRAILQQQPNHPIAKKALRKIERQSQRNKPAKSTSPEPGPEQVNGIVELVRLGRMEQVEQSAADLLREYPESIVVRNLLGIALQRQYKLAEALQVLDEAIAANPDVPESHANRGITLKEMGRPEEALASYDRAIKLQPGFPEAHFNRGNVLLGLGRFEDAAASFEQAIALRDDFAEAHRSLSNLKQYSPDDPHIVQMERLYAAAGDRQSARMELGFALAKAHDDIGNVHTAFEYLADGNQLRKAVQGYDIEDDIALFSDIRRLFAAAEAASSKTTDSSSSPRPVFIVGMLRSGTSLVEQILASHSQVHGGGELEVMTQLAAPMLAALTDKSDDSDLNGLPEPEAKRLRGAYLDALADLGAGESIITDKMPLNFRWIGFIVSAFPDARIIHVKRDAMATCWSIYRHYFPDPSLFAYDLDDIAKYYHLYEGLMSYWRERFPDNILDLDYDRLTEHQEDETRRLLEFCGLDWQDRCLEFHTTERQVRTISASQVRQRMYQGSSAAWKKYERHLRQLAADLDYA